MMIARARLTRSATWIAVAQAARSDFSRFQGAFWSTYWLPSRANWIASFIASLTWTYSRFWATFPACCSIARTIALSVASRNVAGGTSCPKFLSAKVRARWTKFP